MNLNNKINDRKCRNLQWKMSKWQLFLTARPPAPIPPTATDANKKNLWWVPNYYCESLNWLNSSPAFSSNFLSFDSCMFIFCVFISYKLKNLFAFISIFLFCQTSVWQDRTKIMNFFNKTGVSFQYSLLNKKAYDYIKSEILCRYSSRVIVMKSILQCNWTVV